MRITFLESGSQSVKITYSDICNKFKETKNQRQRVEVKMLRDIELLYLAFRSSLEMSSTTYHHPVGNAQTETTERVTYATTLNPKDKVMGNVIDAHSNHAVSFVLTVGVADSPDGYPTAFIDISGKVMPGQIEDEFMYEVEGTSFTIIRTSDCGKFDKICHHMRSKLIEALS